MIHFLPNRLRLLRRLNFRRRRRSLCRFLHHLRPAGRTKLWSPFQRRAAIRTKLCHEIFPLWFRLFSLSYILIVHCLSKNGNHLSEITPWGKINSIKKDYLPSGRIYPSKKNVYLQYILQNHHESCGSSPADCGAVCLQSPKTGGYDYVLPELR